MYVSVKRFPRHLRVTSVHVLRIRLGYRSTLGESSLTVRLDLLIQAPNLESIVIFGHFRSIVLCKTCSLIARLTSPPRIAMTIEVRKTPLSASM